MVRGESFRSSWLGARTVVQVRIAQQQPGSRKEPAPLLFPDGKEAVDAGSLDKLASQLAREGDRPSETLDE